MPSKTVLLSGATGFLGSHLAEVLSNNNYKVLAFVRSTSDLWRLNEIKKDNIILINLNENNFKTSIQKYSPDYFIHAAWQGVGAKERDNEDVQSKNITFTTEMLTLANALGIKKIISFGSQAEYGNFDGRIKDEAVCKPTGAYGIAKLATQNILKSFCEANKINWFWIRIFSLYGERESDNWLIPSVIKNILTNKPMDLTACEQRYDYMYAKDFAKAIIKVLDTKTESGIFNLSSNTSVRLKDLIEEIRKKLNPAANLNFGALPYRPNQVMHMEGNSTKFIQTFNVSLNSNFEKNLEGVVRYYKNKFISSN